MRTKFSVERHQVGEVELDLNEAMEVSQIKNAIKEAQQAGLINWKDITPMRVTSLDVGMDAFLARCYEKGDNKPYNLLVLAESKNNAIELASDYMAGIASDDFTIKLSKADRKDIVQYVNDPELFNFENVIEIG